MTIYKTKESWFDNTIPEPNTGCWLWIHSVNNKGYGRLLFNGTVKLAHRVSHELFKGKIPDGLIVRHICHNPLCCNPNHLLTGTAKDNADDMVKAGRHPKTFLGVPKTEEHKQKIKNSLNSFYADPKNKENPRFKKRKISFDDVKQIKELADKGVCAEQIKEQYGFKSASSIYRILKGQVWNYA